METLWYHLLSPPCADWLLNHPNVDILQQQMLLPSMEAARAADGAGGAAAGAARPLLRAQVVTLAPCVSAYTLDFLRQMALNLTEGQTYAGAQAAPVQIAAWLLGVARRYRLGRRPEPSSSSAAPRCRLQRLRRLRPPNMLPAAPC